MVGIILKIIGGFKRFPERIIGRFKSIIDLSLPSRKESSHAVIVRDSK